MSPMRKRSTPNLHPELTDPVFAATLEASRRKRAGLFPDDLDCEEWRDVVGSTGYQVSSMGRARSKFRKITRSDGREINLVGRILTQSPATDGRLKVNLDGRTRPVHLLVLEAFVGPRPPGTLGGHKDGKYADNSLSNLAWMTPSAVATLRNAALRRDICKRGHRRRPPNLAPNGACRSCLFAHGAAFRARNRPLLNRLGKEAVLQLEADNYYRRITAAQDKTDDMRNTA